MKTLFALGTIFISAISLIPGVTFAAESTGLVTCGFTDASGNFNSCDFCDFVVMVSNIVSWLFGFLVIVAVLMIVYAGIKLVISAGNPSAMTSAKSMITNVLIGFVIVLSAWLIVDTLLKALVDGDSGFGVWNQIEGCGSIDLS
jgi:hypothetical protein